MPNIKSAKKRVKTDAIKRQNNRNDISSMKTATKEVLKLVKENNKDAAVKALNGANKKIDKACKKGLIKENNAARRKSKLAKAVNGIK